MHEHTAIKIDGVYKDFLLPHQKAKSVKSLFTGVLRKRGSTERQHALKNISFEVKRGEFFGIVGRNGSGKSTLLKIIAEIYQPTKGTVQRNGKLVPFIELGVGFNPELTGRENVYLNGALLGFTAKEIDEQYDDIVKFAELERFMDQKLKNYSSGMQVRLAFSVATRAKAEILLIDEVLAVGDADFQRKCFNYFKTLKKSNTTVIFVSHDMDAVREYCDRAMLVEKSEIVDVGNTDMIAKRYTKLFIDEAQYDVSDNPMELRWGIGGVQTLDISAKVGKDMIIFRQKIHVDKQIPDPNIGMRIRSLSGVQITGSNTRIENIEKLDDFVPDQDIDITWSVPNVLADGEYYIEPAIISRDGTIVYEWWDEAIKISVKREHKVPYLIDPGFKVVVENAK